MNEQRNRLVRIGARAMNPRRLRHGTAREVLRWIRMVEEAIDFEMTGDKLKEVIRT